jgi:lantibiotic modifying enzyme
VVEKAADVLLAEAEDVEDGLRWRFAPIRFRTDPSTEMPNWSHGQAGILAAVALAGHRLERGDLVDAARRGGEHLTRLGEPSGDCFVVPHFFFPPDWGGASSDEDEYAWGWCHGAAGTSLAFAALTLADVESVAGDAPNVWRRRCLEAVRRSGIPARSHPGFWDNDGRCCGTAGVGCVFLDSYQRYGDPADLDLAVTLAAAVLEHAEGAANHAWWRFVEHRNADPLLPPGVGWMQGAAGIAAFLFQAARVVRDGPEAAAVLRMESWWVQEGAA